MFDVMTITRKGLERLAQATAANKLVIVGCDATADFTDAATAATTGIDNGGHDSVCVEYVCIHTCRIHRGNQYGRRTGKELLSLRPFG